MALFFSFALQTTIIGIGYQLLYIPRYLYQFYRWKLISVEHYKEGHLLALNLHSTLTTHACVPYQDVMLQGSLIVDIDDGSEGSGYHPAADQGAVALGTPLPPAQEQNWIISGYNFNPSGDHIWCISGLFHWRWILHSVLICGNITNKNWRGINHGRGSVLKSTKFFFAHEKSIFKQLLEVSFPWAKNTTRHLHRITCSWIMYYIPKTTSEHRLIHTGTLQVEKTILTCWRPRVVDLIFTCNRRLTTLALNNAV